MKKFIYQNIYTGSIQVTTTQMDEEYLIRKEIETEDNVYIVKNINNTDIAGIYADQAQAFENKLDTQIVLTF